jgi:vesicle transport protein SEC22
MTKNIEDLLYRGDSLDRMGEMSSRLREDSRKYKKAAIRINWELLLKQVRCSSWSATVFGQRS